MPGFSVLGVCFPSSRNDGIGRMLEKSKEPIIREVRYSGAENIWLKVGVCDFVVELDFCV